MGTELIKPGDDSKFLALRMDRDEVTEMIRENLGGDTLSPQDLDRVKVPAGGATSWEVPTLDGEESMKIIEGVIVDRATRRAYWPDAYSGSDDPPECHSDDGFTGVGDPGGSCAECPYNEFGSAENGIGKACKETRQMFVLTADSLIPIVVTLPPASLAPAKAYFLRLLRAQLTPLDVVTKIGLEKAQSKSGIAYSRVTFAAGAHLDPEAKARMKEYAQALKPAIEAAARVERDEVDG